MCSHIAETGDLVLLGSRAKKVLKTM
jgi:hypothetical protein